MPQKRTQSPLKVDFILFLSNFVVKRLKEAARRAREADNLDEAKEVIDLARGSGAQSVRSDVMNWLREQKD